MNIAAILRNINLLSVQHENRLLGAAIGFHALHSDVGNRRATLLGSYNVLFLSRGHVLLLFGELAKPIDSQLGIGLIRADHTRLLLLLLHRLLLWSCGTVPLALLLDDITVTVLAALLLHALHLVEVRGRLVLL